MSDEENTLAPVIPLFGNAGSQPHADEEWHTTWQGSDEAKPERDADLCDLPSITSIDSPSRAAVRFIDGDEGTHDSGPDSAEAERRLLSALRRRSLSVRECVSRLRADGVPRDEADEIVDRLQRSGFVSDERLAEQIVHAATSRQGKGRVAISRDLAGRGVPREVIDLVISDLPDDDWERATEFARKKAASLAHLDHDTALRRLVGQLARRGYSGHLAMQVARAALSPSAGGGPVRFR